MTTDGFSFYDRIYWPLWYGAWLHFGIHCYIFTNRCLSAALNSRYFPCSGFPSYHLLTSIAHRDSTSAVLWLTQSFKKPTKSTKLNYHKIKVTLRVTVSQSVSFGVKPHLDLMTRYLLLFDSYGLVFVGRPLWREDGSVFYICAWPLPA
jgi:hypothetical protein